MKTKSEILREVLPAEVASKAIANMPPQMRDRAKQYENSTILEESFEWDSSNEGAAYWIGVNNWLTKRMRGWYVDSEARYFMFLQDAVDWCNDAGYKSIEQAYDAGDIYYYEP